MGNRWNQFRLWFRIFIVLISSWEIQMCCSLNDEGLALLDFRGRITLDPYGAFGNWNPNDGNPCKWLGVHCIDNKVQILDLKSLSLEGELAPQLGKLSHLKSLVLCKNNFSGIIPKELGGLAKLELLDLRDNNFTESIPIEVSSLPELKHLLLCGNKVKVNVCHNLAELKLPSKWLFVDKCTTPIASVFCGLNRKFGNGLKLNKALQVCQLNLHYNQHDFHKPIPRIINSPRRMLLDQSSNLAAIPVNVSFTKPVVPYPTTLSSGAFPAVPRVEQQNPSPVPPPVVNSPPNTPNQDQSSTEEQEHSTKSTSRNSWIYMIIISFLVLLLIIALALYCLWRIRTSKTITPWRTGISGQLQKAFITGVPKLNRSELETACEGFSNIIESFDDSIIYKGTLSNDVEIAVVSTTVTSSKEWSKNAEMFHKKMLSTMSRVNHKNFVNLIGFCEEEEPFTRMMVVEYAPNGSLFDHLHDEGYDDLDWKARKRIIMGIAYCLQYMHDLKPPIPQYNISSTSIYLMDDLAAKVAYLNLREPMLSKDKLNEEKLSSNSKNEDPEISIYNFGVLLLEIISGKLPYTEEQGHLTEEAANHMKNNRSIKCMIDPVLQSYDKNELDVICEVIQDCIQANPKLRPTMKDVLSKLRGVISISPEGAATNLSPLWWAELEILSVEAN